MPRYLRSRTGSVFFFTLVTLDRRPILCADPVRRALRTALLNLRVARPFEIDGWVLMPVERHLDYIHYNPVRHGYVKRAIDWPYSTIHRYVKNGVYPADWGGGDDTNWGNFE